MPADPRSKLTDALLDRLGASGATEETVEVIVELTPIDPPTQGSRKEKVRALKDAFDAELDAVRPAIDAAGGEILDAAWINQTVRTRLPADGIDVLARADGVRAIDAPRSLTAE